MCVCVYLLYYTHIHIWSKILKTGNRVEVFDSLSDVKA